MLLVQAHVRNFRSIDDSGAVPIDPAITAFVGQNESGKTAFLKALALCRSVKPGDRFDLDRDYPRKGLNEYRTTHDAAPAPVAKLTYALSADEVKAANAILGMPLLTTLELTLSYHFKNGFGVSLRVDHPSYVEYLLRDPRLSPELRSKVAGCATVRTLLEALGRETLTAEEAEAVAGLKARFQPAGCTWDDLPALLLWNRSLADRIPKFFYFDDYCLLPGKVNLAALARRAADPARLTEDDQTILNLFRLAGVEVAELTAAQGYEAIKARLEALSLAITDKIFKYWKQDGELEAEFDIRTDPADQPPFNDGPNLYVRIKSRRQRVSLPLGQRSKGFLWFFSFVVWFETIQRQGHGPRLVLLLDEPGLNLHPLAQAHLLSYIEDLAASHQLLYSTHSPFMIPGGGLGRVRLVEDRTGAGTVVSSSTAEADARTLFPLRAALGYSLVQNLLPAKKTLLVGGPTELVYLTVLSSALERANRTSLADDASIVPMGGLDALATFVALAGNAAMGFVLLHATANATEAQPSAKLSNHQLMLGYGPYRTVTGKSKPLVSATSALPTDIEDLFAVPFYLKLFNGAFGKKLGGEVKETDLQPGERITDRLTGYLDEQEIELRPGGGFNRYTVAGYLATTPPKAFDKDTLARFEALFARINALLGKTER